MYSLCCRLCCLRRRGGGGGGELTAKGVGIYLTRPS